MILIISITILILSVLSMIIIYRKYMIVLYNNSHLYEYIIPTISKEVSYDISNLILTGLFYIFFSFMGFITNNIILNWILAIIGISMCIPPIRSLSLMIKQALFWHGTNKAYNCLAISAFVNTIVPLIIAILIIFY